MTFPPIGVTAVIAGMAVFNRDAAIVENRLNSINRTANRMQAESGGAAAGAAAAFSGFASTLTTVGTVAAGAFALAGAASIKFAADYQQSLSLTQALTGASDEQMSQLSDTIMNLSRNGRLSLDELSTAATELARAGVPIADVMDGAIQAVEQLTVASGGEIGLEKAAKLTATAMNAFGLGVEEVGRVTSSATVVAQNSALTFTDFGTAVQYAGATFKAAGFEIEDLAVSEALLGKNGITGSVAATSLRGVIQRLIRPSKDAAAVMQQYGIHLFDASGNSIKFTDLMAQLNNAFSDQAVAEGKLTEEERLRAISTLGLQRTGAAFLILANTTSDQLDDLYDSFNRLKITDLVATQMNTLNSQMQMADNNVHALAVSFGSAFLPALTDATKVLNDFLRSISNEQAKAFGEQVLAAGQNVIKFVQDLVSGINELLVSFGLADAAGQFLTSTLIGLAAIIAGGMLIGLTSVVGGWLAFAAAVGAVTLVAAGIAKILENLGHAFADLLTNFGPIGQALALLENAFADSFGAIGALLTGDFPRATELASKAFGEFGTFVREDGGAALDALQQSLASTGAALAPWAAQAGDAGKAVGEALTGTSEAVQSLQFLLQGNLPAAGAAAQRAMADFGAAIQDVAKTIASALGPSLEALGSGINSVLSVLEKLAEGFAKSKLAADALKIASGALELAAAGVGKAFDLLGTAVSTIVNQFEPLAQKFADVAGQADSAGPSVDDFAAAFDAADATIGAAFDAIGTTVSTVIATVVETLTALPGQIGSIFDAIGTTVQTVWQNIQAVTSAIWSAIPPDIISNVQIILDNVTAILGDLLSLTVSLLQELSNEATAVIHAWIGLITAEFQAIVSIVGPLVQAWVDTVIQILSTLATEVLIPFAQFEATVAAALAQVAAAAFAWSASIAANIIGGIVSGLANGAAQVTGAIRGLMDQAAAAARASIQAHSPSLVFAEIGEDAGEGLVVGIEDQQEEISSAGEDAGNTLAQGLIDALDKQKAPVRASSASLVDQALAAFTDISDKADKVASDTATKMAQIGENVGTKVNEAIKDAAKRIADTIQDANDRITELQQNLTQSRSDKAQRDQLKQAQDIRRKARKDAEDDADALANHQQDLFDAEQSHFQDLQDAKRKATKDLSSATTQQQRDDIAKRLKDENDAADESYAKAVDNINRKFAASEADRKAQKQRQVEDAQFEAQLNAETQALDDKLENEALERSKQRARDERDAKITEINAALQEKEDKLRDDAAKEILQLQQTSAQRLDVLEKDFADKAVDLLRKGGENMRPLLNNIQNAISGNFAALRVSADAFTVSVLASINALNVLKANQAQAQNAFVAPTIQQPESTAGRAPATTYGSTRRFAEGGIVPGPAGKPMVIIAHGGELISSLDSAASQIAGAMARGSYNSSTNVYHMNVNPTYPTYESPGNITLDMRALIAMARG